MFIMAQILGIIGLVLKIIAIQFKDKKKILLMFILVNLTIGIELLLLKAYAGAIVSLTAVAQTTINYIYVKKDKKLPRFYIPIYVIISLSLGIYSYKELMDILTILCAMLYIAIIFQTKEKNIRMLSFFQIVCWITYNIYHMAYTDALFKIGFLISNIIAIYKYDIKKNKKNAIL